MNPFEQEDGTILMKRLKTSRDCAEKKTVRLEIDELHVQDEDKMEETKEKKDGTTLSEKKKGKKKGTMKGKKKGMMKGKKTE